MDGKNRRPGLDLWARIAVVAVAVFVSSIAALTYFSIRYFEEEYEEGLGRHQLLLASRIAADIGRRIAFAKETLGRVSTAVVPSMLADPAAGQKFLDERITLHILFDQGLLLVSNEGRLLVGSPASGATRGADLSSDEVFRELSRTGAPTMSRPYRSTRTGRPAITFGVPIRDARGRVIGQLHGAADVDGPHIVGDLASIPIGEHGWFVLVDSERTRVAHPDPALRMEKVPRGANPLADRAMDAGFEGVAETTSTSGVRVLSAVKRVPGAGWALFANVPREEIRRPFVAALPLYGGAVAAGSLVLVLALWRALKRLTAPLGDTIEAVERIAAEPAPGQRVGVHGVGEVARLGAAFDALLDVIESSGKERRALEEQLQQQQRLESLGVLAGGIAHDFNNLLTPIIANASLSMEELPAGDPRRADMEQILEAASRGAELTKRILAFGRRQVLERKVLDLNAEVRTIEKLLRRVIGEDIDLMVECAREPLPVNADPTQLHQMLVNLAVNAREAMPGGGRLFVSLYPSAGRNGAPSSAAPDGAAGAREAIVAVSDTGTGIDPAALPRIFEPFFTTKPKGKGTGLGLATVHGIVQQHGGRISVESAPGKGTTFEIALPIADAPAETPSVSPAAASASCRKLRILVVEDDPLVRALTERILRNDGHTVATAASPAAALSLPDEPRPDLLLSDVVLPGIDGIELHCRLEARWPGLPVIFMSGFPAGHADIDKAIAHGKHFIQKPFGPADLLARVRQTIGPPAS